MRETPQTPGVYLSLFAGDTCIYATNSKESCVLRKLQRGLTVMQTCKRWNIKINEDKTQTIYLPHRHRPPESHLTLNGQNIPFVNNVKYSGVIFNKGITLRLHTEMTEAKAFRTFTGIYSLFKSERLSANIKLTLHKTLIRSEMTFACTAWQFAANIYLLKLKRLQNKVLAPLEIFRGAHRSAIYTHVQMTKLLL
jgi:hypothetical protein